MNGPCPKCGGFDIRQITPGFFECKSMVVAGIIHRPDGAGPMPAERPCGHRFQVGSTSAAELCWCGRQSIGRCADCARPLCGKHGTTDGLFLCGDCLDQRDQRRRDERTAAAERLQAIAAQELAETERRRAAVAAKLVSAQDPDEAMILIIENTADITDDVAKAAWLRLVGSGAVKPTHDIVTAVGSGHFLITGWQNDPGWRWHETSRADAWCAEKVTLPGRQGPEDRWLDGDGVMWRKVSSTLELRKGSGPTFTRGETNWVALPPSQPFRSTGCPQSLGLVLLPNAKPRSVVSGVTLSQVSSGDLGYARVVAAIVRTRSSHAS
jgi:hypothetical protein